MMHVLNKILRDQCIVDGEIVEQSPALVNIQQSYSFSNLKIIMRRFYDFCMSPYARTLCFPPKRPIL